MKFEYLNKLKKNSDIIYLYEDLGWNEFLGLNSHQLSEAMNNSWYVIYVYDKKRLIGTGRVISDGITNAYLCGLGVMSQYRKIGIATEINRLLVEHCKQSKLHIQIFCNGDLVDFYTKMGFESFAEGMRI